jgi:hypothetical protein
LPALAAVRPTAVEIQPAEPAPVGPPKGPALDPPIDYVASMRLAVQLACIDEAKEREDRGLVITEKTWTTYYQKIEVTVDRPLAGSVLRPVTCPACKARLAFRVYSRAVVQNCLLLWRTGWGVLSVSVGLVLFLLLERTVLFVVVAGAAVFLGLSLLAKGVWLALNRPSGFDSLGDAINIESDSALLAPLDRRPHQIMLVARMELPERTLLLAQGELCSGDPDTVRDGLESPRHGPRQVDPKPGRAIERPMS